MSGKDHRSLALWAAECAEHVLTYFEQSYAEDDRPRKALEAGRAWARGELTVGKVRTAALAAHAAAREAEDAAARAAGHAAATAHVAGHGRHAASYAVKAAAAAAIPIKAEAASAAERDWQRRRLGGRAHFA